MPRRRTRRRVERRHHPQAQLAAAVPVVVREADWVERIAYTRTQAAEALGISRSTFNRRVLPYVDTVDTPWGPKLIPVDELERFLAEYRHPAQPRPQRPARGRPRAAEPELVARIRAERASGRTLGAIARDLNTSKTPTVHGGAQWWPSTVRAIIQGGG